ncbi:hypothetical protein PROFUN_12202 [Planoprotostelium fungivorum]|uniref:LysM domain-containing protein n=1 Tax=Planoprotostelium fungivorum TaxID=1890364 RepID=A0A2P6N849_9EUKA|nr:hypothetical protein PROFUN_12202 [Planoprotostelium fungivorum]
MFGHASFSQFITPHPSYLPRPLLGYSLVPTTIPDVPPPPYQEIYSMGPTGVQVVNGPPPATHSGPMYPQLHVSDAAPNRGNEGQLPQDGRLKCKRCQRFYNPEANHDNGCCFHSGVYTKVKLIPTWRCCEQTAPDAPPCSKGPHLECKYQELMARYLPATQPSQPIPSPETRTPLPSSEKLIDFEDVETNEIADATFFLSGPSLPPRQDISDKSVRAANIKVDKNVISLGGRSFLRHHVKKTDTLLGLSIRYKVKPEDLRSVNKVNRDAELYTRGHLLIPFHGQDIEDPDEKSEMDEKKAEMRRLIRKFQREFKCHSESEAQFYLEESRYDYERAAEEFRADEEWEKRAGPKMAR